MEVEEDPSSQFVDFTNATALEQFVSDAEQALIAWHLAGKGHASAEALAASHGGASPRVYSHVLEFEQPPRKPDGSVASASAATHKVKYALSLFLSRAADDAAAPATSKQWPRGREHFTPTMLAIADATRDLVWATRDSASGVPDASAIASDADTWFGVDEFLLLTRTSLPSEREKKQMRQQQDALARRPSRNALDKDGVAVEYAEESAPVVPPTPPSAAFDGSMDTNEAHLLLSAIHLALLNCNCTIPAFVPVQNVGKGTWLGTAVPGSTGNVSINFETDSTPEANSNQSYISGLLDFFRLKLQLPAHIEDSCRVAEGGDAGDLSVGTWVSAAFCYSWRKDEDPREAEKQPMEWRFSNLYDMQSDMKQLSQTLFGRRDHVWGSSANPISQIDLTAVWPNLREGTYVDNAVHSTLDPETAPEWMLDVSFEYKSGDWLRGFHDASRKPTMPLSRVIANLVQAYSNAREISRDVLVSELAPTITSQPPSSSSSTFATPPSSSTGESSRLPGTIPAARAAAVFGNAIGSITSTIVSAATWKGADVEEIQRMISEIFDGDAGTGSAPNVVSTAKLSVPSAIMHSTPVGELVSVLASRMGQLQGVSAMALLWVEFVKALREQWYQQRLLPLMRTREGSAEDKFDGSATRALDALFLLESTSIDLPNPDFRQCLLHQKLQLLNSCILRQAEEKKSSGDQPSSALLRRSSGEESARAGTSMSDLTAFVLDDDVEEDESLSDEEFFDSVELHDAGVASGKKPTVPAAGVRRPMPGMVSLSTGQPLMEPITQVAVPMTEDVAKQQQELLSRLGVGVESTMLRQRLQSAALVSDMQAFKAANPGSCLADFIRWYSPKDWIVPDPLSASTAYEGLPSEGRNVWWFENEGMLSERMRSSSENRSSSLHMWHQMWESSTATPVSKQKRLFDPVGESEKLFHYLETLSPHEMFHQMLVGAIASCYAMLDRACLPLHTKDGPIRIPTIDATLRHLREQCDRAVSLLDEACAESQLAIPTGRDQKSEQEKAKGQLQVAFEMALDACRKMARTFEDVEMMMSQASALLQYLSSDDTGSVAADVVDVVDLLLSTAHTNVSDLQLASTRRRISSILRNSKLRGHLSSLVLHNPSSREPVHREYVIRCICPRPFLDGPQDFAETEDEEDEFSDSKLVQHSEDSAILDLLEGSPVVVNRMYASFTKETVRFALTLAESEF